MKPTAKVNIPGNMTKYCKALQAVFNKYARGFTRKKQMVR